jgi:hypothetical protein
VGPSSGAAAIMTFGGILELCGFRERFCSFEVGCKLEEVERAKKEFCSGKVKAFGQNSRVRGYAG